VLCHEPAEVLLVARLLDAELRIENGDGDAVELVPSKPWLTKLAGLVRLRRGFVGTRIRTGGGSGSGRKEIEVAG